MSASPTLKPVRVLFVCWGNICRSPTAEGIMRRLIADAGLDELIEVSSAGASNEHAGQPPDHRSLAEADARGIDLRSIRARKFRAEDWAQFDLILVADELVERVLLREAPDDAARAKLQRITAFGPHANTVHEVPDPYYGGPDGFEQVYDVLEPACAGVVDHIRRIHLALP